MRFGRWLGARRGHALDAAALAADVVRAAAAAALRILLTGNGEQDQRCLSRLRAHQLLRLACTRHIHTILVNGSGVACVGICYVGCYVRAYNNRPSSLSNCRLTLRSSYSCVLFY